MIPELHDLLGEFRFHVHVRRDAGEVVTADKPNA